jgi:hypothetical protein
LAWYSLGLTKKKKAIPTNKPIIRHKKVPSLKTNRKRGGGVKLEGQKKQLLKSNTCQYIVQTL